MAKLPLSLWAYLGATRLVPLIATRHLHKRVSRGKEDPIRWTEKLGKPSLPRPEGRLIWLHAVGLGEVLSLRGIITMMAGQSDAHFLVTSSTKAGADAFAGNAPPRTTHQFLPLDAPGYRAAFLDHWQPDLCIWAEQDIWPGMVHDIAKRGIPQTLIAARMNGKSYARHTRFGSVFHYIYDQMQLITAQDNITAQHLQDLGAVDVKVTGSLKAAAPPLTCYESALAALRKTIGGRFVWMTAPAHQADVEVAVAAHERLLETDPDALLIIAPRFPDQKLKIVLPYTRRSQGDGPTGSVWVADTFGELGLMYRLAQACLIGGTFDDTEGHNPWEAVALDTAVFYGPRTANFSSEYKALEANGGQLIRDDDALVAALQRDLNAQVQAAGALRKAQMQTTQDLAKNLLALVPHD